MSNKIRSYIAIELNNNKSYKYVRDLVVTGENGSYYSYCNNLPTFIGDSKALAGDTITGVTASHCRIKVNIDGLGDTVIDVSGDSGVATKYDIDNIISNINTKLQAVYTSSGDPYDTFSYASRNGKRIVLQSPTYTSSSYVKIKPSTTNANREIFGTTIGDSGDSHIYRAYGDTYGAQNYWLGQVKYDYLQLKANLTAAASFKVYLKFPEKAGDTYLIVRRNPTQTLGFTQNTSIETGDSMIIPYYRMLIPTGAITSISVVEERLGDWH